MKQQNHVTDIPCSESERGLGVTYNGFDYTKFCKTCKKKFTTGYPHQVYCCGGCNYNRPKIKKKPTPQPCLYCNKSYTPKRCDSKFCSIKCRVANHRTKQSTPQ